MAIYQDLIERVKPFTKSSPERLNSMCVALTSVDQYAVAGAVVECGVWRGGNLMLARLMSPTRECWLYDTFDGMPEPDTEFDVKRPHKDGTPGERAIDRYRAKVAGGTKWDAVGLDEVRKFFAEVGVLDDKFVRFVEGEVEDTLFEGPLPEQIAILRLDVDWYWPTRVALERMYPRLSTGGVLIVDDYGHWMGCKKAVDDYLVDKKIDSRTQVDYSCVTMIKC